MSPFERVGWNEHLSALAGGWCDPVAFLSMGDLLRS